MSYGERIKRIEKGLQAKEKRARECFDILEECEYRNELFAAMEEFDIRIKGYPSSCEWKYTCERLSGEDYFEYFRELDYENLKKCCVEYISASFNFAKRYSDIMQLSHNVEQGEKDEDLIDDQIYKIQRKRVGEFVKSKSQSYYAKLMEHEMEKVDNEITGKKRKRKSDLLLRGEPPLKRTKPLEPLDVPKELVEPLTCGHMRCKTVLKDSSKLWKLCQESKENNEIPTPLFCPVHNWTCIRRPDIEDEDEDKNENIEYESLYGYGGDCCKCHTYYSVYCLYDQEVTRPVLSYCKKCDFSYCYKCMPNHECL